jgi:hypothetical protein
MPTLRESSESEKKEELYERLKATIFSKAVLSFGYLQSF